MAGYNPYKSLDPEGLYDEFILIFDKWACAPTYKRSDTNAKIRKLNSAAHRFRWLVARGYKVLSDQENEWINDIIGRIHKVKEDDMKYLLGVEEED